MKSIKFYITIIITLVWIFTFGSCKKDNITVGQTREKDTIILAQDTVKPLQETIIPIQVSSKETLVRLVNEVRSKGCNCGTEKMPPAGPVVWNDLLEAAAREHSMDMFANDFFNHNSSDGSTFSERISKTGFKWITCGENIAMGYKTEQQVITAWLNSPGHCKNIMNAKFKFMGMSNSGLYWTQDFAGQ